MTHDPWNHFPDLSCPECHVLGKVVRCEDDEWSDDVEPYVCVDCGHAFADVGMVGDLKQYRTEYMRMVEGRPYEPPKPKEPEFPAPKPIDYSAYDSVLKEYYRAAGVATGGRAYALSMDTWSIPMDNSLPGDEDE